MDKRKFGSAFWAKGLLGLLLLMLLFTIVSRVTASITVARVKLDSPSARRLTYEVNVQGRIEQNQEVAVMSQPELLVRSVHVSEGQRVEKGETLAELDREQLREQIQHADGERRALVLQNQALRANREELMKKRDREIARAREDYERLTKQIEKAVQEADRQLQKETREAKRAWEDACRKPDADHSIEVNQIAIEKLSLTLKKLEEIRSAGGKITAPENGIVCEILAEVGQKTVEQALFLLENEAKERTAVTSQPDLLVKRIRVAAGQTVKKGDVLAELDLVQLGEQINSVQGEYKALELQNQALEENREKLMKERKQEISRTKRDYERARSKNGTGEKSEGVAAVKKEWKEAKRAWRDACQKPDVDNTIAVNQITIDEWDLQRKKLEEIERKKGKITAPETGIITSVSAAVGQKTTDGSLFTMTNEAEGMRFVGQMTPEDAKYLSVGNEVSLTTAKKQAEELTVTSLEMDEEGEMMNVTVLLPSKTFSLGESASLSAKQESKNYDCTVPTTALHQENGRYYVLVSETEETVLGKMDIARRVEVTVLEQNQSYAALDQTNLKEDSQIVTDTDRYVGDGDRIQKEGEHE